MAKLNKLNGEIKDNKHKSDTTIKNAHLIRDDIQRNQQRVNDTLTTGYNTFFADIQDVIGDNKQAFQDWVE